MKGVLIASDQTLEWMLPWWWKCYEKHNSYPVAFVDLGLSFEQKEWCRERGSLIPLRVVDFAEEAAPALAKEWEREYGTQFRESRDAWFKKPLACLKSPFAKTIWLDVDCEVRGSLEPLFKYDFAIAKDQAEGIYNSGVIAFRQNHPLLQEWAEKCLSQNRLFRGDQEALSSLIREKPWTIEELPPQYNWSRCKEERSETVIQHWHGPHGKAFIRQLLKADN